MLNNLLKVRQLQEAELEPKPQQPDLRAYILNQNPTPQLFFARAELGAIIRLFIKLQTTL